MVQAAVLLDQDQFSCSICLDLLKYPVTIPCGHSYCMGCIKGYWNQDDHTGVFRCPQCRQNFTPRPVLNKNPMLAEVVEKLKKRGRQAGSPVHCDAGPGDVACDLCTGRKCKAVKSCLVCLASYCETHLQPHYKSPAFTKHKLVKATGNLQEKICSHHGKALEIYCRNDQQFICYMCTIEDHKSHDTVSVATARTERQSSKSLCVSPGPGDLPSITINPHFSFESVSKCVSELKEQLEDVCKGEMSKISKADRAVAISGCFTETGEPSEARATAAEVKPCLLCMEPLKKKQRLICTHAFCAACLERSVGRLGLQCPVCQKALIVVGDQPEGKMTVTHLKDCFGIDCVSIMYNIPSGIQTVAHPNPGKPFTGIQTEAWLPNKYDSYYMTYKDQEVVKLLQRAFEQKLIFTVTATDGAPDRVVFTDIPHARNFYECREPDFLKKVRVALRAKFIS